MQVAAVEVQMEVLAALEALVEEVMVVPQEPREP
jgi:hypothetical protein